MAGAAGRPRPRAASASATAGSGSGSRGGRRAAEAGGGPMPPMPPMPLTAGGADRRAGGLRSACPVFSVTRYGSYASNAFGARWRGLTWRMRRRAWRRWPHAPCAPYAPGPSRDDVGPRTGHRPPADRHRVPAAAADACLRVPKALEASGSWGEMCRDACRRGSPPGTEGIGGIGPMGGEGMPRITSLPQRRRVTRA